MRRLLLGMLLCLTACHRTPPASVFIDPALATVVPADSYALLGVKLDKLSSTPAYKKYFGDRPIAVLDDFQKQTGIDARKDLYEMLIAATGHGAVALIKGKFSELVGRAPNLQFGGTAPVMYKGLMLLGPEQSGVVFFNSSVAAVAPHAQLRLLIDQRDRGSAPVVNTFLTKAAGIPHDVQLWAISLRGGNPLPAGVPLEGNLSNLNRIFQSLQELQAWADLRTGLNANITGVCASENDARRLGDTLRGFVGLGRLSSSNQPEMQRVYDSIQVNQLQNRVELKANIPEDLLEAALPKLPAPRAD